MKKQIEAPAIAKEHGMTRLVFEDDFDSLDTIDINATGEEGYKWYVRRPYECVTMIPEDFTIENSVLTLHETNSLYNYGLATVDGENGVGYTFNKGVLEFRIRVPHYDQDMRDYRLPGGGGPAVWSFSRGKILDGVEELVPQWVETDWMEYWADLDLFPGGHYTITLHESVRARKDGQVVTERVRGHKLGKHLNGFHDAEWHTMTFLWDDDLLVGYYDGEEVQRIRYGEDRLCDPLPRVNVGEQENGVFSFLNQQEVALIINGSKSNPLEIDWIRVWQR